MAWGVPLSLVLLGANVLLGPHATALNWAAWCVSSTVMSLSLPAIGQAFPQALAGRALSAFNLTIFGGVFCQQWGIGLAVDALMARGIGEVQAFQLAFGLFWLACVFAYLVFVMTPHFLADNGSPRTRPMTSLLVIAHAPLATSLAEVARHVYPDCGPQLAALDVNADAPADSVQAAVSAAIEAQGPGEVLVMVDVFGATPSNAARDAADGVRIRVVAGVNVPMLWRTLCYGHLPVAELAQRALDGGFTGVMPVPPVELPQQK
jgi:PTS system ascorbate-specific IIA component